MFEILGHLLYTQYSSCFVIQEEDTGEITFYLKGADVVMMSIVQYNDWLEEEVIEFLYWTTWLVH